MKVLKFIIFFELIVLLALVSLTYTPPYLAEASFEPNLRSECINYHYDNFKYGSARMEERKKGPLYAGLKPNLSIWVDFYGVRPYKVRTNSDSLRDEQISTNKPENTTRILLLGDSFTFGWGVNRSDTYAELLEEQLNKNFAENIEVINTGVPSYGMKDYYKILKHKGIDYSPDMVIIGLHPTDWYSYRDWNNITKTAYQKINEANMSNQDKQQAVKNKLQKLNQERYESTPPEETDLSYLNQIYNITRKENIPLIIYDLEGLMFKHKKYLKNWSEKRDAHFLKATKYQDAGKKYHLSKSDNHPDPCGHELIKKDLYPTVRKSLLNSTNIETSSPPKILS